MESYNAVLTCLKPYFTFLQVLGLFPYDLKEVNYSKVVIEFNILKFCYSIFTLLFALTVFGLSIVGASDYERIYVSAYYWKIIAYVTNMIFILQIIAHILYGREIVKIVQVLGNFSLQMFRYGISTGSFLKFQSACKKVPYITAIPMSLVAVYCLSTSFYTILYSDGYGYFIYLNFGLLYELFHGYFNVTQFFIFTWLISQGFRCIESHLKSSVFKTNSENIQMISSLFNQLCIAVKYMNGSLTQLLSLTLTVTLINEVFCVYSWTMIFWHYSVIISFPHVVSSGAWLLAHLIREIMICYAGSSVTTSIESIKELVMSLITNSKDEMFRNEMRCLLFQMECCNKKIENSFFVIDWKLMLMVINKLCLL